MPKERPILFNAAMVRALLDGSKVQTRRPVKPMRGGKRVKVLRGEGRSCAVDFGPDGLTWRPYGGAPDQPYPWPEDCCPFGAPGDLLWVRETWRETRDDHARKCIEYRADGAKRLYLKDGAVMAADPRPSKWRSAMPRVLSRITLEVTGVRVERVQEITEADAVAEGVTTIEDLYAEAERDASTEVATTTAARLAFARLWQSTYGADSWERNDWVWVVSFQRVKGGE